MSVELAFSEIPFSEINAALSRRPENPRRADARALTATIVVVSPDERLAEATEALEAVGDRTGVRAILISVGESKQPKARLVGNAVALPGLVPAYVNNAVAALRLSSLPTVVWWRGGACEILDDLAGLADHVVLDAPDPIEGWKRAVKLFDRAAFSDLRWTRLTRWRTLLAQFFDMPEVQHAAAGFHRLEIRTKDAAVAGLFAGWLRTTLHLARPLELQISPSSGQALIELISFGDREQQLTLHVAGRGGCVTTTAAVEGNQEHRRTVSLADERLLTLISEELRIRARDRAFEAALTSYLETAQ
jgi:glucose-6-phosphate dehydrogenase assembly protein OpcA